MSEQHWIYYNNTSDIMKLVITFHEQLSILIAESKRQEEIQQELVNQLIDQIIDSKKSEDENI